MIPYLSHGLQIFMKNMQNLGEESRKVSRTLPFQINVSEAKATVNKKGKKNILEKITNLIG